MRITSSRIPSHTCVPHKHKNEQEIFASEADLEELRSWYIANRDWLGQGMRLILAAKSLRVRTINIVLYVCVYICISVCGDCEPGLAGA